MKERRYFVIEKDGKCFTGKTRGTFSDRHLPKLYTGLGPIRSLVSWMFWRSSDNSPGLPGKLCGAKVVPVKVVPCGDPITIEEVLN